MLTIRYNLSILALLCWLAIVGAGFGVIMKHEMTPGTAGRAPRQWPSNTRLTLDANRDTLIMFAHPRCSCTRASIEELNRLLAQCASQVAARVLFVRPDGSPAAWKNSDLRRNAAAIPGVTVQDDPGGAEARLFGGETSGYVLLYNPRGQLLFNGGITGSRGHAGDNAGEEAVISLARSQKTSCQETPVYGCSLFDQCAATPVK